MLHQIDEWMNQYKFSKGKVKEEKKLLEEAKQELEDSRTAQQILQQVAQALQQQAHSRIARIVSKCLQAIFDDPYDFRIIFERKRGRTEARPVFFRDGHEINPMKAAGGGVIDVAAFAGRITELILTQPHFRRVLFLDEPFRFVSREYTKRLREMLLTLADELKIQFVVITHNRSLQAGKVIDMETLR